MRILLAALTMLLAALSGVGCGTRTVYVRDGDVLRLRQDVESVRVWVYDAAGDPLPSRATLREGWYVGPPPEGLR